MAHHLDTRGFPVAMRGYDRACVDSRLTVLETALNEANARTNELQRQLRDVQLDAMIAERQVPETPARAHVTASLQLDQLTRLAEDQARDVVTEAVTRSELLVERAQQEAERIVANAQRQATALLGRAWAEAEAVARAAKTQAAAAEAAAVEAAAQAAARAAAEAEAATQAAAAEAARASELAAGPHATAWWVAERQAGA